MTKDHARFSVTGTVTRVWVSDSGKFGNLTVSVPFGNEGKSRKIEMRGFSAVTGAMQTLEPGQQVSVTGDVEMNPLKDKQKNDIKVDNYTKWVVELTVREIKGAEGAIKATPRAVAKAKDMDEIVGDDQLPF